MRASQSINHDFSQTTACYVTPEDSTSTSPVPVNTPEFITENTTQDLACKQVVDVGKYSVFSIADWFLKKEPMSNKKIQKLCYYAQAWCYALKDYRLENTEFEAWVHGPVSRVLWERFKSFGSNLIIIQSECNPNIEKEDAILLEDVWDTYGDKTGNALEALTHKELPWREARKGYESYERCSVVISPEAMKKFYKSIYSGK